MSNSLSRLWMYRGYILATVRREFALRYHDSILGAAWVILNPLAMILVYTLIFSQIMRARLPGVESPFAYSIFLMSGLLPWGLFTELVGRGPRLFIDQANLIKKMQFPKLALLVIAVLNSLINFVIIETLFIGFLIFSGQFPGWPILAIVPLVLLQVWICAAALLILALLNVFFRDVAPLTNIALQFGFWLTPIVYSAYMIPPQYLVYLQVNPVTHIFESYHMIFVAHDWPIWQSLWPALLLACVLTLMAYRLFCTRAAEMADQL